MDHKKHAYLEPIDHAKIVIYWWCGHPEWYFIVKVFNSFS